MLGVGYKFLPLSKEWLSLLLIPSLLQGEKVRMRAPGEYTKCGDVAIAYQFFGDRSVDQER